MNYIYKTDYSFKKNEIISLFKENNWHSGNYPDMLFNALNKFPYIVTVYDENKLIGLLASMDDGIMNAYIHYVLVLPDYKCRGIGKKMMELANEHYKSYINVVLIAYNEAIPFYEKTNYLLNNDAKPMILKKD